MAAGLIRRFADPEEAMRQALSLARQGIGQVEPNPPVGAVLTDGRLNLLAEGWHAEYGGPHAEAAALKQAGPLARGATLFVTLEPCAHHGKTPPCTNAIIAAGVRKVVAAVTDPAAHNAGRGFAQLRQAGVEVEVGVCHREAAALIAPFVTLTALGRSYVHAKWAMTLDGKIATRSGDSQWISNAASRENVHRLRGLMDAIVVGIGTALADDPLLTARPAGLRTPLRIVLDHQARLPLSSKLAHSVNEAPVLVVASTQADSRRVQNLKDAGVEVWTLHADSGQEILTLLQELGRRRLTHVLVEGGRGVLGSFHDAGLIDEVHCSIAPQLFGGDAAPGPIGGLGCERLSDGSALVDTRVDLFDGDVLMAGRVRTHAERIETLCRVP